MSMPMFSIILTAAGAFIGAGIGSYFATRLAWYEQFLTRAEAIEMARRIDALSRKVASL